MQRSLVSAQGWKCNILIWNQPSGLGWKCRRMNWLFLQIQMCAVCVLFKLKYNWVPGQKFKHLRQRFVAMSMMNKYAKSHSKRWCIWATCTFPLNVFMQFSLKMPLYFMVQNEVKNDQKLQIKVLPKVARKSSLLNVNCQVFDRNGFLRGNGNRPIVLQCIQNFFPNFVWF